MTGHNLEIICQDCPVVWK